MQKKIISVFVFIFLILSMVIFTGAKRIDHAGNQINYQYANLRSPFSNKTFPVKIPDSLSFAGEPVPLYDFDVVQRLDRELIINTYWQSQTMLLMKQYNQVSTLIEPILKKNGLPDDFVYLAIAESGLQNLVSPSGATGVWQFLEPSAKSYGLEVNDYVDERFNFERSTEAACKYLKDARTRFGNWTLAAASFNIGQDALDKTIKVQKAYSYYNLYLNHETSRYIFRILALKEVMKNPKNYGFYIGKSALYPALSYKTVTVDTAINDLADFAVQQGTDYKMLKIFNPWLRNSSLPKHDGKSYDIKIPDKDVMLSELKQFIRADDVESDSSGNSDLMNN